MPDARRRPNILWVSFEDCNPTYGCYGDPVAKTPNLDRLAAEGCLWTHAFSTAGVCAPTRSAVITGMYPISIGTHQMRTSWTNPATPELPTPYSAVVPHYVKCFTEYLRAAGYYCTNNVKTDYQFDAPLTAWDECSRQAHWRNRPDPDQPFFAVFNPTRTHESGMWREKCPEIEVDPEAINPPPFLPDTPEVRESLARMYTHIAHNDRYLGERLAELEEDGLAGNTIVFHWSDHGPLPRGKRWPYDAGIHVPLIVRATGMLEPGRRTDELISTVDLGPTVLSLAGVPVPRHMQGRAFLGGQARPEPRRYVYAARDRHDESYDMVRAVRDRRFKYIRNFHPELSRVPWIPYLNRHPIMQEMWRLYAAGQLEGPAALLFESPRPVEELYDTDADPHEVRNLADDPKYAEDLQRLRTALDEWRDDVGDMGEIPESEMVARWYPGGEQPTTAPPVFVPIAPGPPGAPDRPGTDPAPDGATRLQPPALLLIHCATQGASIAWTTEAGEKPRWRLYTEPIRLEPRRTTRIRVRAVRIGYKDSEERAADFGVNAAAAER